MKPIPKYIALLLVIIGFLCMREHGNARRGTV